MKNDYRYMTHNPTIHVRLFIKQPLHVCVYDTFSLLQPVTEGYQYSQLSPSRSPSGPTYTQLSAGARGGPYHTPTTAPGNTG